MSALFRFKYLIILATFLLNEGRMKTLMLALSILAAVPVYAQSPVQAPPVDIESQIFQWHEEVSKAVATKTSEVDREVVLRNLQQAVANLPSEQKLALVNELIQQMDIVVKSRRDSLSSNATIATWTLFLALIVLNGEPPATRARRALPAVVYAAGVTGLYLWTEQGQVELLKNANAMRSELLALRLSLVRTMAADTL